MDILPLFGFTWYCLGWHSIGWTVWFGSNILFCNWCRGRWSLRLPCMLTLSVWLSLPWLRSGFAPLPPGAVSGACSELLDPASFLFWCPELRGHACRRLCSVVGDGRQVSSLRQARRAKCPLVCIRHPSGVCVQASTCRVLAPCFTTWQRVLSAAKGFGSLFVSFHRVEHEMHEPNDQNSPATPYHSTLVPRHFPCTVYIWFSQAVPCLLIGILHWSPGNCLH